MSTPADDDRYDLARFTAAQLQVYEQALGELRAGRKRSHWMWFIFPQVEGLGVSPTSQRYAIRGLDEARAYLRHPVLGPRLSECAEALLAFPGVSASQIFPPPDDLKLRSSMTLFELAAPAGSGSVFARVLEQFFRGQRDAKTIALLER
jgi:uncharacterized protein (DUF1810 family)